MRPADVSQVRSLHLFRDMADGRFSELVEAAYLQRFPAHVSLIAEQERPDFLHIVLEGSVELFSQHAGRRTTIAVCQPVTTFILAAVVTDQPYLASARTLEGSRILLLPAESVRAAFDADGAFARSIVRELSQSFRTVMKELKNQKLRTSVERLANWILANPDIQTGRGEFRLPYGKRILASQLGMTPENLSRGLAQLAECGVAVSGQVLVVRDIPRLRAFAKPIPSIDDVAY